MWDLARAHVRAVERFDQVLAETGDPSVVINIGRGDGVTVRELVAAFERVFGHDVPITEAPPRPGDAVGAFANVDLLAPSPRLADRAVHRRCDRLRAGLERPASRSPGLRVIRYAVSLAAAVVTASVGLAAPATATHDFRVESDDGLRLAPCR